MLFNSIVVPVWRGPASAARQTPVTKVIGGEGILPTSYLLNRSLLEEGGGFLVFHNVSMVVDYKTR